MKSRVKYEAVATIGKYKDKVTGEERKQFMKCGTVFESEDGRLSLRLDATPGPATKWSGYFSLMPPRPRDGQSQQRAQNVPGPSTGHQNGAPPPQPVPADDNEDDDIPF